MFSECVRVERVRFFGRRFFFGNRGNTVCIVRYLLRREYSGNGRVCEEIRRGHLHNDPNVFSNHTESDEIQVVGKLYKGFIDDEDEISSSEMLEDEDFPRLLFRK